MSPGVAVAAALEARRLLRSRQHAVQVAKLGYVLLVIKGATK